MALATVAGRGRSSSPSILTASALQGNSRAARQMDLVTRGRGLRQHQPLLPAKVLEVRVILQRK
jgi:hypothetical protein